MERKAYSILTIKATGNSQDGKRTFEGIASTPTPDRGEDIVEPKGVQFTLPIPLLYQHNHREPIGWITHAKVTKEGIEVKGTVENIPESGKLKDRIDEAWQSIKYKLVRGLSIGFRALEYSFIEATGGLHIQKWAWYELSAVTIPMNQEATILAIKSAAIGHLNTPGASGKGKVRIGESKMSLREQLARLHEARATKVARLAELKSAVEGGTASDAELSEFDQVTGEIEVGDNDIRLKKAEIVTAYTADPVSPSVKTGVTIIVNKTDKEDSFKGQSYTRMIIAKAQAQLENISAVAVAQKRGWARTNPKLVELIKASVAGGGSGSGEWGAELVTADARFTGDFIEFLHGMTVFDKLGLREIPANVLIKGQDGAATAFWTGESKGIKVTKPDFFNVTLTPLKVAAIAVLSNELIRDSSPSAEKLVRDALGEAAAQRIDTTFLSADAAVSTVSPAGILNGVTGGTSAGNDAAGVIADLKTLMSGFLTAKNAAGVKLVMTPSMALALSLMQNALGQTEFPGLTQEGGVLRGMPVVVGDNVASNDVIMLKPSDIYRIGDSGLEVDFSREATIEMADNPAGASDTPVALANFPVNMFQTNSTAVRVIRSINFAKRRSDAVAFITDAAYGES